MSETLAAFAGVTTTPVRTVLTCEEVEQENKKRLNVALAAAGVATAVVTYSGNGDSGSMDNPSFHDDAGKDRSPPEDLIDRLLVLSSWDYERSQTVSSIRIDRRPLCAAFEDFAGDVVDSRWGGWENNDGASGELTFTVNDAGGTVKLEHTNYFTDSETDEQTF